VIANRPRGYGLEDGRFINREPVTASSAFAQGALISSVIDLVKWDGALREGSLLARRRLKNVMSWILLIFAGLLEACWAVGLKFTDGFSKPLPSVIVGSAIVASMVLLAMAIRDLPVGTAYAVWVSIGILGAAISQPL
jgi:multidrug transporter EmrE-like cation transporter